MACADEGFTLSLACSTQRGYGRAHTVVGELRIDRVAVEMELPELGFAIKIGEIELTECETVNQFKGSRTGLPQFTRGYCLVTGQSERAFWTISSCPITSISRPAWKLVRRMRAEAAAMQEAAE